MIYDKTPAPKMNEISVYRIGGDLDCDISWLEKRGQVLLKVKCSDGLFLLIWEKPDDKPVNNVPK